MRSSDAARARRLAMAWLLIALGVAACGKNQPPIARPTAPPPGAGAAGPGGPTTPQPPEPVEEPVLVPPEPIPEESDLANAPLDELNRRGLLQPVFYAFDSAEIDVDGQAALRANADMMQRNPTWVVTIEGHCDERGTAEYNLALGERRALASRTYLVSLGVDASRLRTVSYGKEFPFDPASNEEAWAKNRRAHFVITAR